MNRRNLLGFTFLFVLGALAGAQDTGNPGPPVGAAAPRHGTEDLSAWQWYQDVPYPASGRAGGLADFLLTPSVFERARPDLADLRLYDSRGREVPYALRVRHARDERHSLPARQFNRVTNPDRSIEVTLDLGESPGDHNEVRVDTSGSEFVRRLRIQGSDDAAGEVEAASQLRARQIRCLGQRERIVELLEHAAELAPAFGRSPSGVSMSKKKTKAAVHPNDGATATRMRSVPVQLRAAENVFESVARIKFLVHEPRNLRAVGDD